MAFALATAESINLLRRCWETRQFLEGLRALFHPARVRLYQTAKRIVRRTSALTEIDSPVVAVPAFRDEVNPTFASRKDAFSVNAGLDSLFSDVDKQLHGVFRLAGARYCQIGGAEGEKWDDPEDEHAYHRLYWAVRYTRASAYGHPRAAEGFERDWLTWRERQSKHPSLARAAYTISERIASLVESLYWLDDAVAKHFVVPIKEQIWTDAHLLTVSVEHALGVHNHLLNNARALFVASVALNECPDAASWRDQAFEIWDTNFPQLVLDDGTFAEQSSHYHLLLCRTAFEYVLASQLCARPLPAGFEAKVRGMFRLADDLLRTDGTLPRFGDNSPDHTVEDLWGLLAAAYHFGLLEEPPRHRAVTPLTIYYCGTAPRLPSSSPSLKQSRLYPDGGFGFLRSPIADVELVAHADPNPEGQAHGDGGRGSFEVSWQGEVVIREPGSFLRPSDAKSIWYRSAYAQNVTCLNGLAPGVTKLDWASLPRWYWPADRCGITIWEDRLRFRCKSFRRIRSGIILERVWWFDPDGNLILEERIDDDDSGRRFPIRFESRLCLGEQTWEAVQWNESVGEATLRSKRPRQGALRITIGVPRGIRVSLGEGGVVPEYGGERTATLLELKGRAELPLRWSMRCQFPEDSLRCTTDQQSAIRVADSTQLV